MNLRRVPRPGESAVNSQLLLKTHRGRNERKTMTIQQKTWLWRIVGAAIVAIGGWFGIKVSWPDNPPGDEQGVEEVRTAEDE